jgi:hypothetical protein
MRSIATIDERADDMSATHHAGGCVKIAYPSRAAALLAMDQIQRSIARGNERTPASKKDARARERRRRAHPVPPQHAYPCPHCGSWHLTSQAAA